MLNYVVGVDEAGRGPLAGPVVAAAVIFKEGFDPVGIADSKKLSEKKRELLYDKITVGTFYGVGFATVDEIDKFNILQASMLAMHRAVLELKLDLSNSEILVDGNQLPQWKYRSTAIVDGDSKEPVIGAASIVAKVVRDRLMLELDQQYPGYGLAIHKGYPTKKHILALETLGACIIHRKSFAPVRKVLAGVVGV